jgi:MFS family permease
MTAYYHLLRRNRNFRLLWAAQIVSEMVDWFYSLAVYDLLLSLTGNRAQSVGLAVVLQVLPLTFASPTAGVINDRLSRKGVMIAANVARFFIVLGMLLVRTPGMVWLAYPLLFLETLFVALFEPAHSAVIPNIVDEGQALCANTLSAITWSFCLAAGASLGGLVAVAAGRDTVFVLNALSFLGSGWLIYRMRFPEPHTDGGKRLSFRDLLDFTPIVEGARYIRAHSRLFVTVFVKLGCGLLGANLVLLPILGRRDFPLHSSGLDSARNAMLSMSLLLGSRGVGALFGPLIGARIAGEHRLRLAIGIVVGFLMAAAGYFCLGHATSFPLAAASVALAHGGGSIVWVFSTTLLQIYTEDRYRGRVFSADLGLNMIGVSVSSYIASAAIDLHVPARTCATILGLVLLIPAASWAAALFATEK